jgi:hypothetical protein
LKTLSAAKATIPAAKKKWMSDRRWFQKMLNASTPPDKALAKASKTVAVFIQTNVLRWHNLLKTTVKKCRANVKRQKIKGREKSLPLT